jgi:hypothetical protein
MSDKVNKIKLQYPHLLLPPDPEDCHGFDQALQIAFDIPDSIGCARTQPMTGLMYEVCDRDLLWRPTNPSKVPIINYYHWITLPTQERDPILSLYSYLFNKSDPYYHEPYDHTPVEQLNIDQFHIYLNHHYRNIEDYFDHIAKCLYLSRDQLLSHGLSVSDGHIKGIFE